MKPSERTTVILEAMEKEALKMVGETAANFHCLLDDEKFMDWADSFYPDRGEAFIQNLAYTRPAGRLYWAAYCALREES